jgi:hypothetical protein
MTRAASLVLYVSPRLQKSGDGPAPAYANLRPADPVAAPDDRERVREAIGCRPPANATRRIASCGPTARYAGSTIGVP